MKHADDTCEACGHARVFHQIGRGAGVSVGKAYCDDRHSAPCACAGFVERAALPTPPTDWQAHVAAYPRQEFLAAFRAAHAALHQLWSAAVGTEGYDKAAWKVLDNALARFARDAGEKVGIGRTEPLL